MTQIIDPELLSQVLGLSGEGVDPKELREQLLTRATNANPQMALLARYLASQQPSGELDEGAAPKLEEEGAADSRQEIEHLQRRLAQLEAALRIFRERNHRLAEALGACARCWGADDACRRCGGDGAPGAFMPDYVLLQELVMPAIRRLKSKTAHARQTGASGSLGTKSN